LITNDLETHQELKGKIAKLGITSRLRIKSDGFFLLGKLYVWRGARGTSLEAIKKAQGFFFRMKEISVMSYKTESLSKGRKKISFNPFTYVSIGWLNPLLRKGYRVPLEPNVSIIDVGCF
jgi:hypothetical protein